MFCHAFRLLLGLFLFLAFSFAAAQEKIDAAAAAFFEKKIRPVLHAQCVGCHGAEKQRGGLRLDSAASLRKGGELGPPVKPGKPDESLMIQALRYKGELKMPPKGKLSDAQIADLTAWVKLGAPWPESSEVIKAPAVEGAERVFTAEEQGFWAFHPPRRPTVPGVGGQESGVRNPIDRFILARLEKENLKPVAPADRRSLLRRVTFDLTGLPPTVAELEAAVADRSPEWFAKVVDRLLASPAYGERWGRRWLDVARYADSNGMDENLAHANAWRYRDYVIRSLNQDKSYRDFVREQIAGDLFPADNALTAQDRIVATGFLSLGPKMLAEDDPVKMQMDIVDEQIDAVGQAFLGLTLGCARCHDHKFDPIATRDYYGLAGIFKSTKTMDTLTVVAQWHERPLATPEVLTARAKIEAQIAEQRTALKNHDGAARKKVLEEARARADVYLAAAQELRGQKPLQSVMSDPQKVKPAGAIVVEAENYQRGNAKKAFAGYGERIGVIFNAGPLPNIAEYDLMIPKAGAYQLELRYAAAESRPLEVHLDGKVMLNAAAGKVTGSWFPDTQAWHVEGVLTLKSGKNLMRLERKQPFPHVDKLALIPLENPPKTPEQIAAAAKLHPQILRQAVQYLERVRDIVPKEIESVKADPQGPFNLPADADAYYPEGTARELKRLRERIAALEKSRGVPPMAMAVSEAKAENTRVHIRGNHLTLGPEVKRRFPRILAGENQSALSAGQSGRRELAEWLTRDDHPLTARVMVNRIWLGHFGEGLVQTPDNFGRLGERPTHPELLDWLATEFVRSGWSIKALHRLIVLSETYQRSTVWNETAARLDPDNRLLWRFPRRRLEAEELRDSLLALSGRLDRAMGGSRLNVNNRAYVTSTANRSYDGYDHACRSIYLPVIRSDVYTLFQVFDFADPSTLLGKRAATTIAPQALFLMNGELVQRETRRMAERLLAMPGEDMVRIDQLYRDVLLREPEATEKERALAFLRQYQTALTEKKATLEEARLGAWQGLCRVLVSSNEFLYVE